jgi:hypothetical protein
MASGSIQKNDLRRGSPEVKSRLFLLSGTENGVLRFPALIQRRRMTVWGLSSIAGADRVGTAPAEQISNMCIFTSADERSRLAERCEHRAAAAWLQLI